MPEITVSQLSAEEFRRLEQEAQKRGGTIEALAAEALKRALDQRAKRVGKPSTITPINRP